MMEKQDFWIEKWKMAAGFSAFRSAFPKEQACWDASAQYYDESMGSSTRRVDVLMSLLKKYGFFEEQGKKVLDIGSGTGSFALPLAAMGAEVTALDCSPEMNRIASEKACKQGLALDIKTGEFDSKSFEPGSFDLVMASMNPGLYHPDPFCSMLSLSRDLVAYIGICQKTLKTKTKVGEPTLDDLLLGRSLSHAGSNLVDYPYRVLKAMGYSPEVVPVTCRWSAIERPEQAMDRLLQHYQTLESKLITKDYQKIIEAYVSSHLTGGSFMNQGKTTMGILLCSVKSGERRAEYLL